LTSYDRLDWHVDSAIEAGQPPENGFTHIGLYLAWLIRHALHDPQLFPADHVDAVLRGEMTGSDLADDIDTKLGSFALSEEGRRFSDARYGAYLDAYGELFADAPDYTVVDDAASYARVEPLLDRLYADWVGAGRPGPERVDESTVTSDRNGDEVVAITIELDPFQMERAHAAPHLEALIPADLTDPPMDRTSVSAAGWGSSLLNRGLRRLGVAPQDAIVVNAIGGDGQRTLVVTVCAVPGVPADQLVGEFQLVVPAPGAPQSERMIGGRAVAWSEHPEFTTAQWARDGLVIGVAGDPVDVGAAIDRLP
jgi:hypothetical protein